MTAAGAALLAVAASAAAAPPADHGRYIVERIAMCGECHTPRDQNGDLDRERWLQGAPIPVAAPAFAPGWAIEAPRIAGLGTYTDAEAMRLLTEGIGRKGRPLRPPMPRFLLTPEDAAAVLVYLRGLR